MQAGNSDSVEHVTRSSKVPGHRPNSSNPNQAHQLQSSSARPAVTTHHPRPSHASQQVSAVERLPPEIFERIFKPEQTYATQKMGIRYLVGPPEHIDREFKTPIARSNAHLALSSTIHTALASTGISYLCLPSSEHSNQFLRSLEANPKRDVHAYQQARIFFGEIYQPTMASILAKVQRLPRPLRLRRCPYFDTVMSKLELSDLTLLCTEKDLFVPRKDLLSIVVSVLHSLPISKRKQLEKVHVHVWQQRIEWASEKEMNEMRADCTLYDGPHSAWLYFRVMNLHTTPSLYLEGISPEPPRNPFGPDHHDTYPYFTAKDNKGIDLNNFFRS